MDFRGFRQLDVLTRQMPTIIAYSTQTRIQLKINPSGEAIEGRLASFSNPLFDRN